MRGSALTQANLRCCLNCRCKLNPRSKHGTLERDILKNDASKCVHDNSSQHLIFTASWRRHRVALQVGAHRWVVGAGWAVTGRVGGLRAARHRRPIFSLVVTSYQPMPTQQNNELASRASLPPRSRHRPMAQETSRPRFPIRGHRGHHPIPPSQSPTMERMAPRRVFPVTFSFLGLALACCWARRRPKE